MSVRIGLRMMAYIINFINAYTHGIERRIESRRMIFVQVVRRYVNVTTARKLLYISPALPITGYLIRRSLLIVYNYLLCCSYIVSVTWTRTRNKTRTKTRTETHLWTWTELEMTLIYENWIETRTETISRTRTEIELKQI